MAQQTSSPKVPAWIADHVARYQATNGDEGYMFDLRPVGGDREVPTLLLTTKGRKTGQPRTLPLIFEQVGENYIVVASKGGSAQHPAWYLNLQADPEVLVQIKARKFAARARTAQGEQRAQLWADMVHHLPLYAAYQDKTARQIPIVILEPSKQGD
jgi:deazaflavin-dependent oxidoreductase (nitroreductase family)